MSRHCKFYSPLPPEEFLNDLKWWAQLEGIGCEIKGRRVYLWNGWISKRKAPVFQGCVHSVGSGSILQKRYVGIREIVFIFILTLGSLDFIISGVPRIIIFSLLILAANIIPWGMGKRNHSQAPATVIEKLQKKYPLMIGKE